jgi:CRISPR system Cascade subunit CasE
MEVGRQTDRVSLLVQSRVQPNWDALPLLYLLETGAERTNSDWKQIDLMLQGLKQGMRLTFRLRANPTRRVSARSAADDQQWHGKRVDLRREADQIEWLRRKGDAGGFKLLSVRVASSVPNLRIIPENKTIGWRLEKERPEQESKARLTFGSVVFEGELEITDADLLRRALERGIGPGKAYGFGLLSLAPPRG